MAAIGEFYIFTAGGECLFSHTPHKRTRDLLITGVLSGLNIAAQHVTSEKIRSLSFQNSKIIFFSEDNLNFVARVKPGAKEEIIRSHLAEMRQIFRREVSPARCGRDWIDCVDLIPLLETKFAKFLTPRMSL